MSVCAQLFQTAHRALGHDHGLPEAQRTVDIKKEVFFLHGYSLVIDFSVCIHRARHVNHALDRAQTADQVVKLVHADHVY